MCEFFCSVQILFKTDFSTLVVPVVITVVEANVTTTRSSWVGTGTVVDVTVILIISKDEVLVDAHSRNTLARTAEAIQDERRDRWKAD